MQIISCPCLYQSRQTSKQFISLEASLRSTTQGCSEPEMRIVFNNYYWGGARSWPAVGSATSSSGSPCEPQCFPPPVWEPHTPVCPRSCPRHGSVEPEPGPPPPSQQSRRSSSPPPAPSAGSSTPACYPAQKASLQTVRIFVELYLNSAIQYTFTYKIIRYQSKIFDSFSCKYFF